MQSKSNFFMALIASLTLGLAPFFPEPHIVGKIKWVLGGAKGMELMDYADLMMHGLPWVFLIYFTFKLLFSKNEVDRTTQNLIVEKEATIIDVREIGEFQAGHIPDAKNIPLSVIKGRVKEFKNMKGPIILYCRSGNRSDQATGFLKAQGLENVFNGGSLSQMRDTLANNNSQT